MSKPRQRLTRRAWLRDITAAGTIALILPRSTAAQPPAQVASGSSDWVRHGYDLQNRRFNHRETALTRENVADLKLKWQFDVESPIQTTPTVVGDTLFFGNMEGYQYALDARTGKEKWKIFPGYNMDPGAADQGLRSSAQYHEGRLYFATSLAKVHCVDASTGKQIWERQLDANVVRNRAQILCSVLIHQGRLFVGTSSARAQAFCLDADTGAVRWSFFVVPDQSRDGGGSIWTAPALDEAANIVYFTTGSAKSYMPPDPMLFTESMLAVDADTGEMLWYDQLRPADPFDLDYSCHPMIFDAVHPSHSEETRPCVAAGNKAGMFCFNRYTGQQYWKAMLTQASSHGGPIINSTATAYNRVFVVSNAEGVIGRKGVSVAAALHAYTGDIMWWVRNPTPINGPVAVAGGVFYQGLQEGHLEAIEAETGRQLWTYQLSGPPRSGMSIANGFLYTTTGENFDWHVSKAIPGKKYSVYAFSPA